LQLKESLQSEGNPNYASGSSHIVFLTKLFLNFLEDMVLGRLVEEINNVLLYTTVLILFVIFKVSL